jgi:hypothetical protein
MPLLLQNHSGGSLRGSRCAIEIDRRRQIFELSNGLIPGVGSQCQKPRGTLACRLLVYVPGIIAEVLNKVQTDVLCLAWIPAYSVFAPVSGVQL